MLLSSFSPFFPSHSKSSQTKIPECLEKRDYDRKIGLSGLPKWSAAIFVLG